MGSLKFKRIILRVIYSISIFIFLKIFFKVADSNDLYEKFDILNEMLKYGFADQIITDQGTNYQSELLQHMYDLLDTYKTRTTAYHPQADGNSEAFVKQIKQMIACYIEQPENQRDWDEKLKFLIFAYNTATHSTTGFSPFEAMTGRIQKLPSDLFDEDIIVDLPYTNIEFIEHLKNKFSSVYKSILENRAFTMNKAKLRHDRVITGCNFKKGDKVWLLIEARKKGITTSIAQKHEGPFTVIDVLNNGVDYIIKQDNKRSRPKTVHRSKLRIARCRVLHVTQTKTNSAIKIKNNTQDHTITPSNSKTRKRKDTLTYANIEPTTEPTTNLTPTVRVSSRYNLRNTTRVDYPK